MGQEGGARRSKSDNLMGRGWRDMRGKKREGREEINEQNWERGFRGTKNPSKNSGGPKRGFGGWGGRHQGGFGGSEGKLKKSSLILGRIQGRETQKGMRQGKYQEGESGA